MYDTCCLLIFTTGQSKVPSSNSQLQPHYCHFFRNDTSLLIDGICDRCKPEYFNTLRRHLRRRHRMA